MSSTPDEADVRFWIRTEADRRAYDEGCRFDLAAALRVRSFIERFCRLSKDGPTTKAGDTLKLQRWQWEGLIAPFYGWKAPTGERRFRRAFVGIPKKNGKSTLCSALSLWHLFEEPGAEVYLCAASKKTTKPVFLEAAAMVRASVDIRRRLKVARSEFQIRYPRTASFLEALANEGNNAEGKNASATIVDELHAWTGREMFESMLYAGAARLQPALWIITTAGKDRTTVCFEEWQRSLRILKGEETSTDYLPFIAAADPGDDWRADATWAKANPSWGYTLGPRQRREAVEEAESNPRTLPALKRYRLNLWAPDGDAWLDLDKWRSLGRKVRSLKRFAGCKATAGIDLSAKHDLSAVVYAIEYEGRVFLFPRLFIPRGRVVEKERADKVPYRSWIDEGYLIETPGRVIDFATIRKRIRRDAKLLALAELAYDPSNAELFCNQQLGVEDGLNVIEHPQGMNYMGPATLLFERTIEQGRIRHANNPVLNWMAGNVVCFEDSDGRRRPIKKRSRGRIDGIVAAIMATSRLVDPSSDEGDTYEGYYDDHDLEEL